METAQSIALERRAAEADGSAAVVALEDLHKSFGSQPVLNGISLSVSRGETLAVLGRSGTGKSVLLRLIIGLERPDSGSVRIHGQDIAGLALDRIGEIRKKIGFLFQHAALYDSLTVEQNVAFPLQHHKKMSRSELRGRVEELLAEVGMEGSLEKMPADISGGMQKRVGLARALALEPDILLLDEPTAGLDPNQIIETRKLIRDLAGEHTIILSTHILPEVEQTCDHAIIINKGKVVAKDSVSNLQNRVRGAESVVIAVEGRDGTLESPEVQRRLESVAGVSRVVPRDHHGNLLTFEVESLKERPIRGDLARAVVEAGWNLNELRSAAMTLEEVFLELTGADATTADAAEPAGDEQ